MASQLKSFDDAQGYIESLRKQGDCPAAIQALMATLLGLVIWRRDEGQGHYKIYTVGDQDALWFVLGGQRYVLAYDVNAVRLHRGGLNSKPLAVLTPDLSVAELYDVFLTLGRKVTQLA